jgi:hypothetical protein
MLCGSCGVVSIGGVGAGVGIGGVAWVGINARRFVAPKTGDMAKNMNEKAQCEEGAYEVRLEA